MTHPSHPSLVLVHDHGKPLRGRIRYSRPTSSEVGHQNPARSLLHWHEHTLARHTGPLLPDSPVCRPQWRTSAFERCTIALWRLSLSMPVRLQVASSSCGRHSVSWILLGPLVSGEVPGPPSSVSMHVSLPSKHLFGPSPKLCERPRLLCLVAS